MAPSKPLAYALENPFKVGAATTLFVGGLFTLLFFLRIGYMPDVNLESVSSLLYAVSLIGSFLCAYVMVLLVLPGLMLATARESTVNVTICHLIVLAAGAGIIWVLAMACLLDFVPTWVAWLAGGVVTVGFPFIAGRTDRRCGLQSPPPAATGTAIRQPWDSSKNPWKTYFWSVAAMLSMVAVLSVTIVFVGSIGMSGDIRRASSGEVLGMMGALSALVALSAAFIGSVRKDDSRKLAIFLAPFLLVLALVSTGSFTALPAIAVRAVGQGEIPGARIVVDGKTCREISLALGQAVCTEAAEGQPTAICPVMIRSRIGSQVVLDFAPMAVATAQAGHAPHAFWAVSSGAVDGKAGTRWIRRVVVDKSKLLNWQPLRSFEEKDNPLTARMDIPPVAAWLGPVAVGATGGNGPEDDAALAHVLSARCCGRLAGPMLSGTTGG